MALAGLCARKILNPHWEHERVLVHMVETLEATSQENTLSSWILEKACDAAQKSGSGSLGQLRMLRCQFKNLEPPAEFTS